MSAKQSIATVPDAQTAELLREVLHDGGLEDVEVRAVTGLAYMPRVTALDYEVRVPIEDVVRARRVLADFEEESGAAAVRQAGEHEPIAAEPVARGGHPVKRRQRVLVVAAVVVLAIVVGRAALLHLQHPHHALTR